MRSEPYDVVVVDDAADVRAVVSRQLRLNGRFVVVGEGGSGAEALALVREHEPAIVLLDASMPDMDGLEALPGIVQLSPSTLVVILTGFDGEALERAARALGAADFVEKAAPIRDLPGRLLRLLGAPDEEARAAAPDAAPVDLETTRHEEAVFAEHLERFQTVFDQAAIGMATLTLAGAVVRVNPALTHLMAADEESLVGRHYADLAGPDTADAVAGVITQVARGDIVVGEIDHSLVDGGTGRWVHATLAAVRDNAGRALYVFAQAQDMTRRRETLAQLRASEERFRLLVESVQDYAIFMLDPDGIITTWNLGAQRMKGYTAEQIRGQHFRIFYRPEAQAVRHPEYELEVAVREGRYEEEGWRVRNDGTQFWANVVITALFDTSGKLAGFAKVTRDVTERRVALEASQEAATELAGANERLQLAADKTSEFVAVTAHELQSPIAAISGASEILLEHWRDMDESEREESLQSITRGAGRISRLLGDLLTASRLEAGSFELTVEDFPLAAAIAEALAEVTLTDGVVEVICPESLRVRADRSRLAQIVTNLANNARKYGSPPITIRAAVAGESVEIRVCDAGAGVTDDLVPNLFDKFTGGSRRNDPGTGLGLFIVRALARAHGGDAWYERHDGGQPCFVVTLPPAG